ncbi:hypothetical protein M378DRAFT_964518 [Amanita muscaria Koide BX008]|uniref:Uncharacterized protein n=1 Tax=Amanita muscaria (strain Koide BX008) TaxID=946122 RepID=A0A0C2SAM7_AMAMK|nr:hypothetical protein M378DRAFT_964518 [Amanita muscaria Koide BX008]
MSYSTVVSALQHSTMTWRAQRHYGQQGMVPCPPTATPLTKILGFAPANWHWKRPSSSAFLGQYGTLCDMGCR